MRPDSEPTYTNQQRAKAGTRQTASFKKKRPSFAGGNQAAQGSGYEHEYAVTYLVQPEAWAHVRDAAAKVRNVPIVDNHRAHSTETRAETQFALLVVPGQQL
jgi:hypothetical protein